MGYKRLTLAACMVLSACGASVGAPDSGVTCGDVKQWSKVDREAFIKAEETLPPHSPIMLEIEDYDLMRRKAEACKKAAGR
jgi:hypothetical protein